MKNDLLLMAQDGLIYVTHFVKEKQMAYKLNKKYNHKNISKVELSPQIISKSYVDLDELETRNFGEVLSYFTRVLESNFLSLDLAYFYKNIKTLRVQDLKNRVKKDIVLAEYSIVENKIILYDNYLKAIYHELFHMASSIFRSGKVYSGFSQGNSKDNIGFGLNEGYTELLYRRYFGNVSDFVEAYTDEVKIARYLEKIIGQRNMESLYLRADLLGLFSEMLRYLTNDEVVDLISKIEKVSYLSSALNKEERNNFSPELYLDYLREVYLLLFTAYVRKLRKEYEKEWISNQVLDKKIDDFLEENEISVCIGNNTYPFVNKYDFVDIFNDYFQEFNKYLKGSKEGLDKNTVK